MLRFLCIIVAFISGLLLTVPARPSMAASIAQDESAAVIFTYHRVGEDQFPANNIRREQFEAHIRELKDRHYNVMPLPAIIAALRNGDQLPPRTVALTFDGGHKSVADYAGPLLLKNNLPFTIFIATGNAAAAATDYMSWSDIRKLARHNLVTVGIHPVNYQRLYTESPAEILRQVNSARAAFRDNLGSDPQYFAYPFGEYSKAYRDIVAQQNFAAAFGEQSGVAYHNADMFTLPRFSMTEEFGGLDRFLMTAQALPLPVKDISPEDPYLSGTLPSLGFTVDAALKSSLKNLACFISGEGKSEIQLAGESRVEIRLDKPLAAARTRINCTMPGPAAEPGEDPRWRWFGLMLITPRPEGWTENDGSSPADSVVLSDETRG